MKEGVSLVVQHKFIELRAFATPPCFDKFLQMPVIRITSHRGSVQEFYRVVGPSQSFQVPLSNGQTIFVGVHKAYLMFGQVGVTSVCLPFGAILKFQIEGDPTLFKMSIRGCETSRLKRLRTLFTLGPNTGTGVIVIPPFRD